MKFCFGCFWVIVNGVVVIVVKEMRVVSVVEIVVCMVIIVLNGIDGY